MIYPFRCKHCNYEEEFITRLVDMPINPECPKCETIMKRVYEEFHKLAIFRPKFYEHIAPDPIWINTRKQLREECGKHGVRSLDLEGSYNRG